MSPQEQDVIKIGLVASQNGPLIPWGTDAIRGAKIAVNQVNSAGGIDGKMVQLLIEDCSSTPEGGQSATKKLINDGIVGLLGSVSSGITQAMTQISTERGIPHVVIGGTKPDLTKDENVFRVCYTDIFQAHAMAKFAYDYLGLRRMTLMTDIKQPYSVQLSVEFKKRFEKYGGEIVAEETYASGQMNFTDPLTRVKAIKPDGMYLSGFFSEVGPIVRQAYQLGFENVKYLGGDGWESRELISSGGEGMLGGFFTNHYSSDEQRAEVQEFLKTWNERHGEEPWTTMGALGYDAAAILMDAIVRAGSIESKLVIEALGKTVGFKGVTGEITLKGMGGDAAKPLLILEVTKDGFKVVTPMQYKDVYPDETFLLKKT